MDNEKRLAEQLTEYRELGRQNKKIDVAALMINALDSQKRKLLSPRLKRWAYLISIGLPPFGLLFALKFYTGPEDDAKTAANICAVLTLVSLLLFWLLGKAIFSGSGVDINQIEQIKPTDIQQLLQ